MTGSTWVTLRVPLTRTLVMICLVAVGLLYAAPSARAVGANPGDSFDNATCAVPGPPPPTSLGQPMCWDIYRQNQALILSYTGYFSALIQTAPAALDSAAAAWNGAYGPQFFCNSSTCGLSGGVVSVDEYPYLQPGFPSQISSVVGITANFDSNGTLCGTSACIVHSSEVFVNSTELLNKPNIVLQYVFAHEFGHVLGLDDLGSSTCQNCL